MSAWLRQVCLQVNPGLARNRLIWNEKSSFTEPNWTDSSDDAAASTGCGDFYNGRWFQTKWPAWLVNCNVCIESLEINRIYISLFSYGLLILSIIAFHSIATILALCLLGSSWDRQTEPLYMSCISSCIQLQCLISLYVLSMSAASIIWSQILYQDSMLPLSLAQLSTLHVALILFFLLSLTI